MSQCLLFNALLHRSSVIDSEHNFGDLLLFHVTLHVGEARNPVHADVICGGCVMSLQKALELRLGDVLIQVTIAL